MHVSMCVCVYVCTFGGKVYRLLSVNVSEDASNSPKTKIVWNDLKCFSLHNFKINNTILEITKFYIETSCF